MAQEWYYTTGGEQKGPAEWSHLKQLAAAGTLTPADLVWNAEMPQWTPASDVQGLMSAAAALEPMATPAIPLTAANANVLEYRTTTPLSMGTRDPIIYAGFFLRFLAYLVDGVILLVIMVPVLLGFLWVIGALDDTSSAGMTATARSFNSNPTAGLTLRLLLLGVAWIYFAYQESSAAQATIGKRFLGLVVTDTNGQRISLARASGRHFGKIISGIIFSIGYIMAGFTERKQALHDMIAGCLVVLKPS